MGHCGLDGALRDRKQVGTGCPSWSLGLVGGGAWQGSQDHGDWKTSREGQVVLLKFANKKEKKRKKELLWLSTDLLPRTAWKLALTAQSLRRFEPKQRIS